MMLILPALFFCASADAVSADLRLRTDVEVCEELGVNIWWFRRKRRKHLIPYVRLGYRTFRYDPVDVRKALDRLRIKAVAQT
jgi:hypothetical protein